MNRRFDRYTEQMVPREDPAEPRKIIQIAAGADGSLTCLTNDGLVWEWVERPSGPLWMVIDATFEDYVKVEEDEDV